MSETSYKSRQNGIWKPVQVTKLDFQKIKSPPRVKILGWDLDGKVKSLVFDESEFEKGNFDETNFLLGFWSIKTRTPGINQDKTKIGNLRK